MPQKRQTHPQPYSFRKPKEALEFCQTTSCEVALLDIQMRNMSGVELAKELKLLNPGINIIYSGYAKMGIVKEKVDCDYYDWLDGKIYAINLYHGEYMAQYSWGEITNAGMK
ncbi:response regulator transcription factor [Porcipelethomonas sp.]|uniref:response regulator transcription factor n=1 Tax=Porcipelethomonas sp. TaxID=2981675 RepID=UPI003EF623B0